MQPHALLVPYPETGHINPLMQLAIHLASNGVCVTFVNTSYNHQRILQSNAGRLPSDLGLPIRLVDVPDCLSENDNRDHDLNNLTKVIANVGHPLEELMDKMSAAGERITCIISDIAATQTSEIAKKRGIPRVAFWPPNASVYSCFCHAIHAISEGTFPKNGKL